VRTGSVVAALPDSGRCVSLHGNPDGVRDEKVWIHMRHLARNLLSLTAGLIFGFGLALSGMLNPARVRGFLDIFGTWDPSLAFVLGGAVVISAIGYIISRRMESPALDVAFHLPAKTSVDSHLVIGAATFGIGWGISGLCPGPAVASLSFGIPSTIAFTIAMVVGTFAHDRLFATGQPRQVLQ
jgi:uncharacterized protein